MDFGMPFLLETQTIEDAAALCRELGLSFVELNLNFPQCGLGHMSAGRLNALKRKYGVYFTIHLDENLNVCDFNPLVSGAYLQTVRDCVRLGLPSARPSSTCTFTRASTLRCRTGGRTFSRNTSENIRRVSYRLFAFAKA